MMIASQLQQSLEQDKRKNSTVSKEALRPSATITNLIDEPLFLTGYLDEEDEEDSLPPPMEDDIGNASSNSSIITLDYDHSPSDQDFQIDLLLPDILGDDVEYMEDACAARAEAVSLISAGKPTLVELLKTTRPSSSLTAKRMTFRRSIGSVIQLSKSKSKSKHSYRSSVTSSTNSDTSDQSRGSSENERNSFSSEASSVPSTPVLDAEVTSPKFEQSPITPVTARSIPLTIDTEFNLKPLDAQYRIRSTSAVSMPYAALPSEISVRKSSLSRLFPKRRAYTTTSDPKLFNNTSPQSAPMTPQSFMAGRNLKMVARDASAREPILQLPPSPVYEEHNVASPRNGSASVPKLVMRKQRIRRMASSMGLNEM